MKALDPYRLVILPNICFELFLRPHTAFYKVLQHCYVSGSFVGFAQYATRWCFANFDCAMFGEGDKKVAN